MQSALENQSNNQLHKCPREDSFPEMYQSIGDIEEQAYIRNSAPDKAHCVYLQADCNACIAMPALDSIDAKFHGKPCFNNPYVKDDPEKQKQVDRAIKQEQMIEEARVLLDACKLGLIKDLNHLQAGEFIAIRWMLRYEMLEQLKVQMTANMAGLGTGLM